eukprot:m.39332 g.39332  ORF g.39332 m.39332 type:complete len:329 (-) comp11770_c0_seq1:170-1156(-)
MLADALNVCRIVRGGQREGGSLGQHQRAAVHGNLLQARERVQPDADWQGADELERKVEDDASAGDLQVVQHRRPHATAGPLNLLARILQQLVHLVEGVDLLLRALVGKVHFVLLQQLLDLGSACRHRLHLAIRLAEDLCHGVGDVLAGSVHRAHLLHQQPRADLLADVRGCLRIDLVPALFPRENSLQLLLGLFCLKLFPGQRLDEQGRRHRHVVDDEHLDAGRNHGPQLAPAQQPRLLLLAVLAQAKHHAADAEHRAQPPARRGGCWRLQRRQRADERRHNAEDVLQNPAAGHRRRRRCGVCGLLWWQRVLVCSASSRLLLLSEHRS